MSLSELLRFQRAHRFQFWLIASNHTLFLILSMKWIAEIYNTWRHNWIQQKQTRWSCNYHLIISRQSKFAQFFKFDHFDLSLTIISFIHRQTRERHWFCSSTISRMCTLRMTICILSQWVHRVFNIIIFVIWSMQYFFFIFLKSKIESKTHKVSLSRSTQMKCHEEDSYANRVASFVSLVMSVNSFVLDKFLTTTMMIMQCCWSAHFASDSRDSR